MKPYVPFLLYELPEAYLLILVALGLLGLKIKPGRLTVGGLALGILIGVSRHYLFSTGLHTPVILVGLVLALTVGFELSLPTAVTGCFLSFFLLLMGESFLVSPVASLTKIPVQNALANPWLHVAFGWVSAGFLVLAACICHLGGVALIRAPEARNVNPEG